MALGTPHRSVDCPSQPTEKGQDVEHDQKPADLKKLFPDEKMITTQVYFSSLLTNWVVAKVQIGFLAFWVTAAETAASATWATATAGLQGSRHQSK